MKMFHKRNKNWKNGEICLEFHNPGSFYKKMEKKDYIR